MKRFTSGTQKIGEKGEKIAERFLTKQGFSILERNYTKKQGEIDIIAKKQAELYFFEVKTIKADVSHETNRSVSRETYNPFQNITPNKLKKLANTAEIYLSECNVSHETLWQLAGLAVFLDLGSKRARVKMLENIIVS